MTSKTVPGPNEGARPLAWVTIEETADPDLVARIEHLLLEHHVTVRVLGPGVIGSGAEDVFEVQIPESDFERALAALEELDDSLEP